MLEPETTAYRLINAEADGLPGLVVDKYSDYLVVQCLTLGIDQRKEQIAQLLVELFTPHGIIERSDVNIRKKEGLSKVVSILAGEGPPPQLKVLENGIIMNADLYQGHKTGLYLDQRDNRQYLCQTDIVKDLEVLNVFAYTGGFTLYAAYNGAGPITSVEVSPLLLNQIEENLQLNFLDRSEDNYVSGDAFQILRQMRDKDQQFDFIILDPPKFAHQKRDISAACRGYKDINLLAINLLRPNGLLATFSCSGAISQELFQKVLFGAALDAERDVQIIRYLYQASDHPVLLSFPESFYLKGFLCRVY
jgi:23S rRNA (cytosine1962-C5)-methyltransferase